MDYIEGVKTVATNTLPKIFQDDVGMYFDTDRLSPVKVYVHEGDCYVFHGEYFRITEGQWHKVDDFNNNADAIINSIFYKIKNLDTYQIAEYIYNTYERKK